MLRIRLRIPRMTLRSCWVTTCWYASVTALASCAAPSAVESTTRIVMTPISCFLAWTPLGVTGDIDHQPRPNVPAEVLLPLSLTARCKTADELISCAWL
jgi:hypothetical protein